MGLPVGSNGCNQSEQTGIGSEYAIKRCPKKYLSDKRAQLSGSTVKNISAREWWSIIRSSTDVQQVGISQRWSMERQMGKYGKDALMNRMNAT